MRDIHWGDAWGWGSFTIKDGEFKRLREWFKRLQGVFKILGYAFKILRGCVKILDTSFKILGHDIALQDSVLQENLKVRPLDISYKTIISIRHLRFVQFVQQCLAFCVRKDQIRILMQRCPSIILTGIIGVCHGRLDCETALYGFWLQ